MELYERHLTLVYQQASFVVWVSGDPLALILFSLEKKIQCRGSWDTKYDVIGQQHPKSQCMGLLGL